MIIAAGCSAPDHGGIGNTKHGPDNEHHHVSDHQVRALEKRVMVLEFAIVRLGGKVATDECAPAVEAPTAPTGGE